MIEGRDYASVDGDHVDLKADTARFHIVRGAFMDRNGIYKPDSTLKLRDAIIAAGKRFGAYMILAWHGAQPEDQVDVFVKAYGDRRPGELPPSLDLEADSAAKLGLTESECLAWAERAYKRLCARYGIVMIYTSVRVWAEVFGNRPSIMGFAPLWLKVPYPWQVRRPHHPESAPTGKLELPSAWKSINSPGVWIVQYQGDAVGVPGFSSTVDCNYFVTRTGPDSSWLASKLYVDGQAASVAEWQKHENLASCDGVIGPDTFCALTA